MKHSAIAGILAACAILSGCCINSLCSSSTKITRTKFPDNKFSEIPNSYFNACDKPGVIKNFTYKTRDNQKAGSPEFEKHALVYLPYGYDEKDTSKKYDVMYLMHGGSDSPEWYFGGVGQNTRLKNMIDHMIANGETKPLIICAVSYYTQYSNDATKNCIDFHYELDKDIIPIFEKQYHTYAKDTTQESLNQSRTHRAFSGFSMGACATWAAFEYCLPEMAYFLPISGDCWAVGRGKPVDATQHLINVVAKHGKTAADFKIYSGCGTNDIAERNLTPMIEEMKKHPETFIYCDNFEKGNLYQCIRQNGGHDVNTVMRILYNGLPKMFD